MLKYLNWYLEYRLQECINIKLNTNKEIVKEKE